MNEQISLRTILRDPGLFTGWLYLPSQPWTLDTEGIFFKFDKNADPNVDQTPEVVRTNNWQEVLDAASIEDIVDNARAQLEDVSVGDLLQAFIYYVENDAFIKFR